MTEDMFHTLGRKQHDNCSNLACDDTNSIDLYRGDEDYIRP